MSTYSNFPSDKEIEDRKLLPLSHNFYADDPTKYDECIVDFIGLLIKSMRDEGVDSIKLSQFQEMKESFKGDKDEH